MIENNKQAPGQPGEKPHWLSGAKSGIGKSLNAGSNVSFSLSHGIINEVYFPREDIVCINQFGLIVTNGKNFFSEETTGTIHETKMYADGIPGYTIINTCKKSKYIIEKEIITDPERNSLYQLTKCKVLAEKASNYHLYLFISPHIKNNGDGNNGWIGDHKGVPMLFAERDGVTFAVACSIPWKKRTVGYKGASDGVKELRESKKIVNEYESAYRGNIMLTAEIDLNHEANNEMVIVVGFGSSETEAGHHALASLFNGFANAKKKYISEWQAWQKSLLSLSSSNKTIGKNFRTSAAVLKINTAKSFLGGTLASMSIPWGELRTEDELGGYHLVWPRDLVETSWGFLALDAKENVLQVVNYLAATQEADGRWPQNMWLDGKPYWMGLQMDQVALPLLIVNSCYQYELLDESRLTRYWENIRLATEFIITNGPFTQQDRWEIQPGISIFTIATEIAALLAAAEFAEIFHELAIAKYCRETADFWNENIEAWTYATDTALSKKYNVEGYYIRINPTEIPIDDNKETCIKISYKDGKRAYPAVDIISVDALALVRFGLREPDDPRILNTLKLIDGELKVETPNGPCWHRFTNDAYGEDDEGNPFYEAGKGRAWPLLTGERAHYEVAAGNIKGAKKLLQAMDKFSYHGMLPEQIWDREDIPEKELFFGKYTGSAMPLTWAHAEYIKLCHSIKHKRIFDMPELTFKRYIVEKKKCNFSAWRFDMQTKKISPQKEFLRIEVLSPALIHFTTDNWHTTKEIETQTCGFNIHVADISIQNLSEGEIIFTFFWKGSNKWEGKNFSVMIV